MRRSLVLTNEAARHPFLASLPPHVRSAGTPVAARPRRKRGLSLNDLRDFMMTYCASFVAVIIFIY
ncbi:hypothetical protein [Croceicoccus estronivorus]|uniref:hypothetical protein n=1 Tax=Croceicoccus estronivorus TaxID=1172626 RepID=UPI0009EEE4F4|nr:hypothetical protein [Croceicoccus estronivorus]